MQNLNFVIEILFEDNECIKNAAKDVNLQSERKVKKKRVFMETTFLLIKIQQWKVNGKIALKNISSSGCVSLIIIIIYE